MRLSDTLKLMALAPPAFDLAWEDWGDIHTVYQRSSAETHVLNDTTVYILRVLEAGSATLGEIIEDITEAMGVKDSEFAARDLAWAAKRLEELGLIEWRNGAAVDS